MHFLGPGRDSLVFREPPKLTWQERRRPLLCNGRPRGGPVNRGRLRRRLRRGNWENPSECILDVLSCLRPPVLLVMPPVVSSNGTVRSSEFAVVLLHGIYVLVQRFVPYPPVQSHPQALLNFFVLAVHRLNYDDGDGPGGIDLLRQRRGCRASPAASQGRQGQHARA